MIDREARVPLTHISMPSLDIIIPAYNAEQCLRGTLGAILEQTIPEGLNLGVIVVNNRSSDGTGELIDRWANKGVRRVDYFAAQNRSSTLNAGVAASNADYILLLDADCQLLGTDSLRLIYETMAQNIDAGFGYTTGSSNNFWERYHRSLEAERLSAGWQSFTTACCLIKREMFNTVGGFSAEYQHYGFEDRDFICRLRSHAGVEALKSMPELRANHDDVITLRDVCEKMYVSGRYSGEIFKRNFPEEYLTMGYSRVDVETAPKSIQMLLKLLRPFKSVAIRITDFLTQHENTPLVIGRPFVRLCSALSYFEGTVDRGRNK